MKNTEMLLSFDMVKANREGIVPRISEGCKQLEDILNHCIDLNMPTIACCAGHKLGDYPYITMSYTKDTRKKINGFLNKLSNVKNIQIMFSTTGFTDNPFNVTIYTSRSNRDNVFEIINECLKCGVESELLNSDMEVALNLAIDMDYRQDYSTVTIFNKLFQKKYMVGVYGPQFSGNVFDEHKDSKKNGSFGMTYYLYKKKEKLKIISDSLEQLHNMFKFRNGFQISSCAHVNEKIDRMDEYNGLLRNETGSIRRPM